MTSVEKLCLLRTDVSGAALAVGTAMEGMSHAVKRQVEARSVIMDFFKNGFIDQTTFPAFSTVLNIDFI
jgi:hypothetical protein